MEWTVGHWQKFTSTWLWIQVFNSLQLCSASLCDWQCCHTTLSGSEVY